MTLESAERLVEKILQQLEIQYEVSGESASHQHDDGRHGGGERTIVVDANALTRLPHELHPFVTTSSSPAVASKADDTQPDT
jgi:hypothetical protein